MQRRLLTFLLLVLLLVVMPVPVNAATVPLNFNETEFVSGLVFPTSMEFAPDGRLFVSQQHGDLRVVKNGVLLPTPFVHVDVDPNGERALTGIAFDPNFATNQYIYLYYAARLPTPRFRVSRFTANGDVAVPGSEFILIETDTLGPGLMHNGGAIHFGKDGKLYIAIGDNNYHANAQMLTNLFGKILRINPDGTIPTSNPFYTTASGKNRAIWAYGLRNPFTFAVQPGTGRIFINDVGASAWEEINEGSAGANYGWPETEGPTSDPRFVSPLFAYAHGTTDTTGCAITGGTFYNPPTLQFPAQYTGVYFFQDLCSKWIRKLDPANGNAVSSFISNAARPVDLKIGLDGSLYYLTRLSSNGFVYKIAYSTLPAIAKQPTDQTVNPGEIATFSVLGSGNPPLTYQWQRNGVNISGATGKTYSLTATTANSGAQFRCVVSNGAGSVTSKSATLRVTSNQPPTGTITAPAQNTTYQAGRTYTFAGTGTDPEDGTLPPSAFTWEIVFHHADHTHPFEGPFTGVTSGSFTIPSVGETATNVWYRVNLTVTDSNGLSHSSFRDLLPQTSTINLVTSPPGLQVTLDGQPKTTPYSTLSVVGIKRTVGAISPQTVNSVPWEWDSWSSGVKPTVTFSTDKGNQTRTAVYRVSGGSIGTGTGLAATYYDNQDFTGPSVTQTDRTINFNWGETPPVPGIGADTFSVRWQGQVQPQFSETYTFYTQSNDGVRLWVNGQLLINNWTDHSSTENSGSITLVGGQKYTIMLEYYENLSSAVAQLSWKSPSTPKSIVPSSQLYP